MTNALSNFLPASDTSCNAQEVKRGTSYQLVEAEDIRQIFKMRVPFSHKGTYGHALVVAGNFRTMGAALLSLKGCVYGGAGLTTAVIPVSGLSALNSAIPEVMFEEVKELEDPEAFDKYNAIAIGPGIGQTMDGLLMLDRVLSLKRALVIDADALNNLAQNKKLLNSVSKDSILTPHVKEFDRLFDQHENWWERLETARAKAKKMGIVIILKNQYTFIIDQTGNVSINPTGNPAMAQGGMGDVLTGLVTAYIAQGYDARSAAILACYFHGKAGDELAEHHFNVTASQVAAQIPITIKSFVNTEAGL